MLIHCGNLHKANGVKGKAEFSRYAIHSYSTIPLPRMPFASFTAPNLTMHQQHLSTPTIKLRILFFLYQPYHCIYTFQQIALTYTFSAIQVLNRPHPLFLWRADEIRNFFRVIWLCTIVVFST